MNKRTRNEPRSYVVRVYRRSAGCLVGSVEDIQSGRSRAFGSARELWTAIGGPARPAAQETPPQET